MNGDNNKAGSSLDTREKAIQAVPAKGTAAYYKDRAAGAYRRGGVRELLTAGAVYWLKEAGLWRVIAPVARSRRYHRLRKGKTIKLHLGCGGKYFPGFVNIDCEDWAYACDLVADVTDLGMFAGSSVDHIFNHALLEHVPSWKTMDALREWYRVLKPGGTIQIEVPDLRRIFEDWLVHCTRSEKEALDYIFGGDKSPCNPYRNQDHCTGYAYLLVCDSCQHYKIPSGKSSHNPHLLANYLIHRFYQDCLI